MKRLLLTALFFSLANAYPFGAPQEACSTLEPQHEVVGQTSQSAYVFTVVNNGDGTYQVTVEKSSSSAPDFKGFIVQARAAGSATSVGTFNSYPSDAITMDCFGSADTITHTASTTKTSISFRWHSAGAPVSGVTFNGAVVQIKDIYWAGLQSGDLGNLQ